MLSDSNISSVDRRGLLRVGACAAAAAVLTPRGARAAQPGQPADAVDLQGAGYFKTKVGDAEVTIISDGTLRMPPVPTFAVNASKEEAATQLRRSFLEPDAPAPLHVNVMLVKTGGKTVLVDTGNGPDAKPGAGRVSSHLRRMGIKPGGIDMVVITHLHGDHAGGLFDADLRDMASSADIVLSNVERDFWLGTPDLSASSLNDEFKARMTANARKATDSAGKQLRAVKADEEIVPGLRLMHLPGHTPGHIGLKLTSGERSFVYFADAIHFGPLQFERPEWYVAFDADPKVAVQSRQELFAKLAEERTLVAGSHIAFPALGHLRKEAVGYSWVPTIWEW